MLKNALWILLFSLISALSGWCLEPIRISGASEHVAIGDQVDIVLDPRGTLALEGLFSKDTTSQFQRHTELSNIDELTGLFNKRWFSTKIQSKIQACRQLLCPWLSWSWMWATLKTSMTHMVKRPEPGDPGPVSCF